MVIPLGKVAEPNDSFAELALPLFDSLFNFACWLARDSSEAEDLVQETYAKAIAGFSSFEMGTNFRAWIFRILRNAFLNSRSGLAATRTVAWEDEEESGAKAARVSEETPESIFVSHANEQAMRDSIETLPILFREVLLLADVEEMAYREIAETLGIPTGTVMSRLARARRILRENLRDKVVRT